MIVGYCDFLHLELINFAEKKDNYDKKRAKLSLNPLSIATVNAYFALPWFATAACLAAISSWLPK